MSLLGKEDTTCGGLSAFGQIAKEEMAREAAEKAAAKKASRPKMSLGDKFRLAALVCAEVVAGGFLYAGAKQNEYWYSYLGVSIGLGSWGVYLAHYAGRPKQTPERPQAAPADDQKTPDGPK